MSWYRLCTCCVLSVLLAWLDGPFSSDKSNIVGIVERGAGLNVCGCVWCLCVCVWCLCVWVVCVCVVTVLLAGRWTERSSIPDSGRGLFARTSRPGDPPPPHQYHPHSFLTRTFTFYTSLCYRTAVGHAARNDGSDAPPHKFAGAL